MEAILAICAGVSLAAACGFRVFVPLLAMGIAVHSGAIEPTKGFDWIGSWPAILMFGAATVAEVGGYYIPWIDNALDSIASPAAVVAGTVVTASVIPDIHPAITWTAALLTGGGAAGIVQGGTVVTRALSSATTGGIGNPAVSTAENGLSIVLSILAIVVPIIALIAVLVVLVWAIRKVIGWVRRRASARQTTPSIDSASSDPGI